MTGRTLLAAAVIALLMATSLQAWHTLPERGVALDPAPNVRPAASLQPNGTNAVENWIATNYTAGFSAYSSMDAAPQGAAYDPESGLAYFGNDDYLYNGGPIVVNVSSGVNETIGLTNPDADVENVVFDPADGYIYTAESSKTCVVSLDCSGVPSYNSTNVTMIEGTHVIGTIPLPADFWAAGPMVYDPANQEIYEALTWVGHAHVPSNWTYLVAIQGAHIVSYFNWSAADISDGANFTYLTRSPPVLNITYDASDEAIYVALADPYNTQQPVQVSVYNSNNSFVGNVSEAMTSIGPPSFDSSNGYLYIPYTDGGASSIAVVGNTTAVANITLASPVTSTAYLDGLVYAADSATITVLSGTTIDSDVNTVAHPLILGTDLSLGFVVAASAVSGNLFLISRGTTLFNVSGFGYYGEANRGCGFEFFNPFLAMPHGFFIDNGGYGQWWDTSANCYGGVAYVHPGPLEVKSLTATPDFVALNENTTFVTDVIGGQGALTFVYANLPPGCASADTATLYCIPSAVGNFTAIVTVTDTIGETATANTTLFVRQPFGTVTIDASPKRAVFDVRENFSANVSGGTNPYRYNWSFGNGEYSGWSDNNTVTYLPTITGTFVITVTVEDAFDNMTTGSMNLTVYLSVHIRGSSSRGTAPLVEHFNSTIEGGVAGYSYLWNFGDGNTSTQAYPNHTYTIPGNYTASLAVRDGAGHTGSGTYAIVVSESTSTPTTPRNYSVTFLVTAAGVTPSGASWSVTFAGLTESAAMNVFSINFTIPNGTYSFTDTTSLVQYALTPASGGVTVSGAPKTVRLTLSKTASPSTSTSSSWLNGPALGYAVIAAPVVVAVGVTLYAVRRARGPRRPPRGESRGPSSAQSIEERDANGPAPKETES